MASNPLLDLRKIDEEKRKKISSNDGRNEEIKKSSNEEIKNEAREGSIAQARSPIRKPSNKFSKLPLNVDIKEAAKTGIVDASHEKIQQKVQEEASAQPQTSSYTSLRERVLAPASKEAITRLNLDMPEGLHDRMKLYCAINKIKIRELVCALVEDFLAHDDEANGRQG